jgi:arginase family enzyme
VVDEWLLAGRYPRRRADRHRAAWARSGAATTSSSTAREKNAVEKVEQFWDGWPIYLAVDIDVLDPTYASDVVYAPYGGLDPGVLAALVRSGIRPVGRGRHGGGMPLPDRSSPGGHSSG